MFYVIFYPLFYVLLRTVITLFGRLKSSGTENVPRTGPVIYCPNHISDADPPTVFVTAPRRAWYIGKEELFVHWFWGWFFKQFRGIPIKRDSADRQALRVAESKLNIGDPVVIFPEGRCSPSGLLLRLQPGAALLALRAEAAVVPVGIENTNKIMPYGEVKPHFSADPVRIVYGPPIYPKEFAHLKHSDAVAALTHRIGLEIARLTNQNPPPEEPQTPRRARREPDQEPSTIARSIADQDQTIHEKELG
jgi:1-acyl-sn-glycerol-3-phosphate acyltransferase